MVPPRRGEMAIDFIKGWSSIGMMTFPTQYLYGKIKLMFQPNHQNQSMKCCIAIATHGTYGTCHGGLYPSTTWNPLGDQLDVHPQGLTVVFLHPSGNSSLHRHEAFILNTTYDHWGQDQPRLGDVWMKTERAELGVEYQTNVQQFISDWFRLVSYIIAVFPTGLEYLSIYLL